MRRNIAGQFIGAQMNSASDGTAFTGAVTVYVSPNGAAQVLGSGGLGSPSNGNAVHMGNGYHEYAPSQAETNHSHVAFTFIGSGAIPTTVQVFPVVPPAGAGAIEWDYTLTNILNGAPIAGADVWVTSDAAGTDVLGSGITNASGVVTFFLDAGTVYVWRQASGFNFTNPDQETVS